MKIKIEDLTDEELDQEIRNFNQIEDYCHIYHTFRELLENECMDMLDAFRLGVDNESRAGDLYGARFIVFEREERLFYPACTVADLKLALNRAVYLRAFEELITKEYEEFIKWCGEKSGRIKNKGE
ncbi:hypothetical protein [Acidaminococcus massiliensis]|jgi:hypothetical protein|uniref:hypothetical protein n=1 Tax=Acidaminococcus massiliensis TaxID=1852375 RepID=UPI002056158F|nr:hypothetical protein [Acidaminococcus massiliensis]DAR24888.1 MAG TPA: hypothetical protein [Caudoviricetes sp.]